VPCIKAYLHGRCTNSWCFPWFGANHRLAQVRDIMIILLFFCQICLHSVRREKPDQYWMIYWRARHRCCLHWKAQIQRNFAHGDTVLRQEKHWLIDWLIDWLIEHLNTCLAHISIPSNAHGAGPFWPVLSQKVSLISWDEIGQLLRSDIHEVVPFHYW
jgi:hypothetical protein